MIVLSHRGFWRDAAEKNQPVAFHRSFDAGFGTETDLRDHAGRLVIAHDMPCGREPTLEVFLAMLGGRDLPLAINIKADGLGAGLLAAMAGRGNWFTFDMAVPDMLAQIRMGLPVFTRSSEFEPVPPLYDQVRGVWADDFSGGWQTPAKIRAFLADGKQVCLVSPELHGRDAAPLWSALLADGLGDAPGLMLCTDRPDAAAAFFGSKP